ncbi:MAG: hypothetical protein ABIQ31_18940 [Ferruginibacter sp.]
MNVSLQQKTHHILRIAVAMCFIGHGAFGIITKAVWCNYFAVFGIGKVLAYQLMPVVGGFDILFGIIMLVYPVRAIPAWLVTWGIVTALLRPLSGEPFAEFIERAGNYGAPLALLILSGIPKSSKGWFTRIDTGIEDDEATLARVKTLLKVIVFFLLAGHGWLNIAEKAGLVNQYTSLGFSNPKETALIVGIIEITAALVVLIKPIRPLLLALFIWKMGTELLYPHYALFEWIERGGSYGALLALWMLTERGSSPKFTAAKGYNIQQA